MSSIFQPVCRLPALRVFKGVRWNSMQAAVRSDSSSAALVSSSVSSSSKRPHLGIQVDPNHGLWAFFRKKEVDDKVKYETLEAKESLTESGRPWHAAELRRKSFRDLHTLWYVLLRERNLLATQREEARRMGVQNPEALAAPTMDRMCRKSMARLKFVLNERRLYYEKLGQEGVILREGPFEVLEQPQQSRRMTRRERTEGRRKASSSPSNASI